MIIYELPNSVFCKKIGSFLAATYGTVLFFNGFRIKKTMQFFIWKKNGSLPYSR